MGATTSFPKALVYGALFAAGMGALTNKKRVRGAVFGLLGFAAWMAIARATKPIGAWS